MDDWRPGKIFRTETRRFTLRSLTEDDVGETYLGWWNDAEVQKGFGMGARDWTRADGIEQINKFNNITSFHLGIIVKESGRLIGFYSLFLNPKDKSSHANNCIGEKDWWNKGVAFEVGRHLVDYRFRNMAVEKINGRVAGDNQVAKHIYRKLGFSLVKTVQQRRPNDPEHDLEINHFLLTREDWLLQNKT